VGDLDGDPMRKLLAASKEEMCFGKM
jgi:hypothetical protein